MIKVIRFLLGMMIVTSSVACYRYEQPLTERSVESTQALLTPTPVIKATPNNSISLVTPIPPVLTATTEPTQTPPTEPTLQQETTISIEDIPVCSTKGQPSLPGKNFGFDGNIVYQIGNNEGLYTIGGTPLGQSQLPVNQMSRYDAYGFSPDGKWFAYSPIEVPLGGDFYLEKFTVVLLSDTGERIENVLETKDFISELPPGAKFEALSRSHWINNQLIYTTLLARSPTSDSTPFTDPLPKVFDPFKGEWRTEFTNKLLDKISGNLTAIGFSADMQHALYYNPPYRLVLYEYGKGQSIWEDQEFSASSYYVAISWSPDSLKAIAANIDFGSPDELRILLIDHDGKNIRMIGNANFPSQSFKLSHSVWSPDGRYLAISNTNNQIYFYDTTANKYVSQCPLPDYVLYPEKIVWSPDSQFIAFGGGNAPLRIMSIESGEVAEILPIGVPVGWSESFPVEWP